VIIDCHGHFTTTPPRVMEFRAKQIEAFKATGSAADVPAPHISDDEIRAAIHDNQLKVMKERGIDLTIFSPRALGMDHQFGDEATNVTWAVYCNDLVHRACQMFPDYFVGVCQLPQVAGQKPGQAVFDELDRCIDQLGFIGANLNPDPTGGQWSDPPLWDKDWWYPLYEKLVEHDVPVMIHVSGSCNPHFNAVATHYINGDTTAFVQFMTSDLFKDFPSLKFIIPHGGGAAPYHWGRYQGIALDMKLGDLNERMMKNLYFDTCVYHQPGIDLLLKVIPSDNVLFASETIGAVRAVDPKTGRNFDDTHHYIEQTQVVSEQEKKNIYLNNALGVYKRLGNHPKFKSQ
jgi:4-oxalmesaconate hydratase